MPKSRQQQYDSPEASRPQWDRPEQAGAGYGARRGWQDETLQDRRYGTRSGNGDRDRENPDLEEEYGYPDARSGQSSDPYDSGSYSKGEYERSRWGRGARGGYGSDWAPNLGNRDPYREKGSERGMVDRATDEVASWFGDDDAQRRRASDHRGKGPRGYNRSDDRIREDVSDTLSDHPAVDASEIDVTVSEGEVTLAGEVDSRSAKRQAEDCADRISGVKHVQNNLRVKSGGSLGGLSSTGENSPQGTPL